MTEAALERRLRYTLSCSRIVWRKAKKREFARVESEQGKHDVVLPPGYDDWYTLQTLIHELAHPTIGGELGAFGVFEEDVIERVIEPRMMDYLARRPRSQAWWLAQIRKARDA